MKRILLALVIVGVASALPRAQNWPNFRGVNGGVVPDDPRLPDTWSTTENVVWKTDIPGVGFSSPVVWGDHVFVTTAINTTGDFSFEAPEGVEFNSSRFISRSLGGTMGSEDTDRATELHRWVVYGIDAKTGKIRWERQVKEDIPAFPSSQKNSYATETPATDGERVYAYFSYAGLYAFDMDGTPVWSKPMDTLNARSLGAAASPALHKDRLYIVNDNDMRSYIAAYDTKTGDQVWRVPRDEKTNYSTPFIWENPLRTEIVTKGTKKVRSYSLDGKLLWELSGFTEWDVPAPFTRHGLLYVQSGFPHESPRPAYAIRPGASGDISLKPDETSNEYIAWSHPALGTFQLSSIVYGDYYYTLFDRGIMTVHDAKTGKEVYPRQRVGQDVVAFTSSPWAYNGKVFAISQDGDTFVFQAGPEFKVLGKNPLNEFTQATPAIADGSLFIRTATKLYRIGKP